MMRTRARSERLLVLFAAFAWDCDPNVLVGRESDGAAAFAGAAGSSAALDAAAGHTTAEAGAGGIHDTEAIPPLPWSAAHESGSTSEWTDGEFGWVFTTKGGSLEVSSERAKSGSMALKSTLATTVSLEQAVVGRKVKLVEGYYSAWFFVPRAGGTQGRVIMKLSAWGPDADVFDITMRPKQDGALGLGLYSHAERSWITDSEVAPVVPLDTWFEVEAYYRSTGEADGRIVVWQDGVRVIDIGPRVTGPNEQVTCIVGSVASVLMASRLSLYVDDVRIRSGSAPD